MMRGTVAALGLVAVLGLAGCAGGTIDGSPVTPGGTSGTPSDSTPSGSTPSGSTPSGSTPSGSTPSGSTPSGSAPTQKRGGPTIPVSAPNVTGADQSNALRLSASLGSGLATARTARITLNIVASGETITAHGAEALRNGKATALDLTETVPGVGSLRIIMAGPRTWVRLPPSLNTGGKPWTLVSASSSNPTVRTLAGSLGSTQSSASIESIIDFVGAASSIELVGSQVTDGVPTTRYKITVETSMLPDDYPGRAALVEAGVDELPVEISIDSAGRPIRVTEAFSVQGQAVSTRFDLTHYNEPVTIAAPPPNLVNPH